MDQSNLNYQILNQVPQHCIGSYEILLQVTYKVEPLKFFQEDPRGQRRYLIWLRCMIHVGQSLERMNKDPH